MKLWRENSAFNELEKNLWAKDESRIKENNGFHTMPESTNPYNGATFDRPYPAGIYRPLYVRMAIENPICLANPRIKIIDGIDEVYGYRNPIIKENNGFHTMPEYQSLPLPGSKIRELQKELEELNKYKSDDGKIWCRFIKINKYYDQTHGNFYEFTNTDLDEYTNEFGVILEHTKTSFYNTYEYNYIYNNGCLTRMDYFFEDFKQFYMPINEKIDDDYIAFINESVDILKERSQKQNGPRLVKKID